MNGSILGKLRHTDLTVCIVPIREHTSYCDQKHNVSQNDEYTLTLTRGGTPCCAAERPSFTISASPSPPDNQDGFRLLELSPPSWLPLPPFVAPGTPGPPRRLRDAGPFFMGSPATSPSYDTPCGDRENAMGVVGIVTVAGPFSGECGVACGDCESAIGAEPGMRYARGRPRPPWESGRRDIGLVQGDKSGSGPGRGFRVFHDSQRCSCRGRRATVREEG